MVHARRARALHALMHAPLRTGYVASRFPVRGTRRNYGEGYILREYDADPLYYTRVSLVLSHTLIFAFVRDDPP